MQAVILAGGRGTRLQPLTITIPKPLVPIDDLPILEIVLRQLKYYGFREIVISVGHLANLIMAFFGNGEKFGLNIRYSLEDDALGTAGPLTLIDNLGENFLVMNGDLLTSINFRDLYEFHLKNMNDITISSHKKQVRIDLGILETDGYEFLDYIEKPTYEYQVSMGIYVMNRKILGLMERKKRFDLPDLMLKARREGLRIRCYYGATDKIWLDIGRPEDYAEATRVFNENRGELLP